MNTEHIVTPSMRRIITDQTKIVGYHLNRSHFVDCEASRQVGIQLESEIQAHILSEPVKPSFMTMIQVPHGNYPIITYFEVEYHSQTPDGRAVWISTMLDGAGDVIYQTIVGVPGIEVW